MFKRIIGLAMPLALLISGCGATVGDACTTASDCANQVCINQPWTPGGYCSKSCTVGDDGSCPSGSTCIANGNGTGNPACFRVCSTMNDCRNGYACLQSRTGSKLICVASGGGI